MLEALRRKVTGASGLGSGLLQVKQVEWLRRLATAEVTLEIRRNARTETWRLRATGVLDANIELAPTKKVVVTRRHILLDNQVGPFSDLRFRGISRDFSKLFTDLWESHLSVAENWINIEDCFEGAESFPRLLTRGNGVAMGPTRLIEAYASVFRRHGLRVGLVPRHRSKPYWSGGKFDLSTSRRLLLRSWALVFNSEQVQRRADRVKGLEAWVWGLTTGSSRI